MQNDILRGVCNNGDAKVPRGLNALFIFTDFYNVIYRGRMGVGRIRSDLGRGGCILIWSRDGSGRVLRLSP